MKDKLTVIHNDEPKAGTYLIAQGFDRRHADLLKLINKYKLRFEKFGELNTRKFSTKGRPGEEYLLNESQTMFLGTLFKNTDLILDFKEKIVQEFSRLKKLLESNQKQKLDPKYQLARIEGKAIRKETTDQIQKFVAYAKCQGGSEKGCELYYSNITKMVNGLLFIVEGKFKNLRNVMSGRQLMVVGAAEGIIDKGIKDGMEKGVFYKEIYKDIKSKVMIFAELHGQSHVIENQLKLDNSEQKTIS